MHVRIERFPVFVDEACEIQLVARLSDLIFGTCRLIPQKHSLLLSMLYVHDDYRRKGVATKLIEEACAVAREMHREAVTLNVQNRNAPAIALYRKLGFIVGYEYEPWIGDQIGMAKAVRPAEAVSICDVRRALGKARQTIYNAVEANVDLPGFDPNGHVSIREIDALLSALPTEPAKQESST